MIRFYRNRIVLIVSVAILSFVAGVVVTKILTGGIPALDRGKIIRQASSKLISPILACEIGPETDFTELAPVKNAVASYVKKSISDNLAGNVSVYFRLINTGRWFAINKEDVYTPSSLYKALVLLAYYKEAETNPGILSRPIPYISDGSVDRLYGGGREDLISGNYYTVNQLIDRMIKNSYNSAMRTLANYLGPTSLDRVVSDLNLPMAINGSQEEAGVLTVAGYSLVLRVLFGASYLDRMMSEKALEILSKTDFKDGLRAGVPADLEIAHKFGVHAADPTLINSVEQLHDCGIVYFPGHPYLLCVMTKGQHQQDLARTIAGVSKVTYEETKKFFSK